MFNILPARSTWAMLCKRIFVYVYVPMPVPVHFDELQHQSSDDALLIWGYCTWCKYHIAHRQYPLTIQGWDQSVKWEQCSTPILSLFSLYTAWHPPPPLPHLPHSSLSMAHTLYCAAAKISDATFDGGFIHVWYVLHDIGIRRYK